jgi:hypothetical protein
MELPSLRGNQRQQSSSPVTLPPITEIETGSMCWEPSSHRSVPLRLLSSGNLPSLCPVTDDIDNGLSKMSLDYIAPGGRKTESVMSSSAESAPSSPDYEAVSAYSTPSASSSDYAESNDRLTPDSVGNINFRENFKAEDRHHLDGYEYGLYQASTWPATNNNATIPVSTRSQPTKRNSKEPFFNSATKYVLQHPCRPVNHSPRISQTTPSTPTKHRQVTPASNNYNSRRQTPQIPQTPRSGSTSSTAIVKTSRRPKGGTPRKDRHPYDDDERWAMLYLRVISETNWDDVVRKFAQVFPPGTPRRCTNDSAKPCPETYVKRCTQGLQCRYYRVRDEEGLRQLRDGGLLPGWSAGGRRRMTKEQDREMVGMVCEQMVRKGRVGRETIDRVRLALGQGTRVRATRLYIMGDGYDH